ncbi:NAD(P)-binding protein [Auricularia subglabra TFB-10046 SS5]|uniref:NAD(P)-binding protein n=1 Tax=Auricularia subglabra (strain TFB-10046 / SS5) TaxID=717982 RepID=J0DCQ2_AURST|nr:NAD(P)-binding protein [Auricularia subglabra TFB-10046 SS5]
MRIVATGANGRVGSRVVIAALKGGHDVLGIDVTPVPEAASWKEHPKFDFVQADLRDFQRALELFKGYDAVINLAGVPNPTDYLVEAHNTNVILSWNVLRACAELGINRVAMASSVNAVTLVYSAGPKFHYFPIDEAHPALPDEPYGLSKVLGEMQADSIVRRFPSMRIASLRLHWSTPSPLPARNQPPARAKNDLWGWVQEDSGADAFLRAVTVENDAWKAGHEVFFVVSPTIADPAMDSRKLREEYWPDVPVREGKVVEGEKGFFDCTKAERLLGWVHKDVDPSTVDAGDDSRWY